MTATVAIRPAGGTEGPRDPNTGRRPVVPHDPHYTGKARVYVDAGQALGVDVGDNEMTLSGYIVEVPASVTTAQAGDLITPSDTGDPALDGIELRVEQVVLGSVLAKRVLRCELTTDD